MVNKFIFNYKLLKKNPYIYKAPCITLLENELGKNFNTNHLISIGVGTRPQLWCNFNKNLFKNLSTKQLKTLQQKKSIFLIDQSLEGYSTSWLWDWFHKTCIDFKVNPNCVIYITGDLNAEQNYKKFVFNNNIKEEIKVISFSYFEPSLYRNSQNFFLNKPFWDKEHFKNFKPVYKHLIKDNVNHWFIKISSFERKLRNNKILKLLYSLLGQFDFSESFSYPQFFKIEPITVNKKLLNYTTNLQFKIKNKPRIKMFDILQKRPRSHRIIFFYKLWKNNLLENNICSMNTFVYNPVDNKNDFDFISKNDVENMNKLLPLLPPDHPNGYGAGNFMSENGAAYINDMNINIKLQSFCSVISEVFYFEKDDFFISEKTFKSIANSQPFIILSTKNFLKELQRLGYKTFHPFIDETYDDLNDKDRMNAIISEIIRLNKMSIEERINWFKTLQPILEHNYNHFQFRYNYTLNNLHENIKKATKKFL